MKSLRLLSFVFTSVLVFPSVAFSQNVSLEECRKLKIKIDHYNELRRDGGSGAQMDAWRRARRELEKSFNNMGCRQYWWELK